MVGLSVILENYADLSEKGSPQIINKGSIIKPSSPSSPPSPGPFSRARNPPNYSGFLQNCSLCSLRLLPGKDIYMYKGDKAFCSVECRYRQIFMDEEEGGAKSGCTLEYNCSMAATSTSTSSSSSSRSSGKGARNAFAY